MANTVAWLELLPRVVNGSLSRDTDRSHRVLGVLQLILLLKRARELSPIYHLRELLINYLLCPLNTSGACVSGHGAMHGRTRRSALLIARLDLVGGMLDHDYVFTGSFSARIVALAHELFI